MAFGMLMRRVQLTETEKKDFRYLFVQSLLSGFGSSFFFVVVSSYFIQKTGVSDLPTAYIMSGIFGYILITLYKKWQRGVGAVSSYTIGFALYGLTALLLYALRHIYPDGSKLTTYIAYIGFVVVLPYSSMQALGFSTICLRVFNISQSKRLVALIGTGEVISSIVAYLTIPFLSRWLGGSVHLLVLSGIFNIAAILPLRKTYASNKEKLDTIRFASLKKKMGLEFFINDRFYLLLAVVTIFSVAAVYFADYTYLLSVRYIATESGYDIAAVVAVVFSIIKIGELAFSLLSGSLLRSYGMLVSLMLLPVLMAISSAIGFATGIIFLGIPFFIVFFLLGNKWFDRVIRKGVSIPAMKVIFQVTDPDIRASIQAAVDGTVSQYATIAAGIILWGISLSMSGYDLIIFFRVIIFIYLLVFLAWCWATYALHNSYKKKIGQYLRQFSTGAKKPVEKEFDDFDENTESDVPAAKPVIIHNEIVDRATAIASPTDIATLTHYIVGYNPGIKPLSGEKTILHKASGAYYNNDNYFSRLLIIRYIGLHDAVTRITFVKEYFGVSELPLRYELAAMLNRTNTKIPAEDKYFFSGLVEDVAAGIVATEATANDIASETDSLLIEALEAQVATMQSLLFELLKILFDRESIEVVYDILNSKDKSLENRLFAIELLDNLLDSRMKKILIPIMEDSSWNTKKDRLRNFVPIYQLTAPERLRELLMSSYLIVNPYVKQLALSEYFRLTGDETMLRAYAASNFENLSSSAFGLLQESAPGTHASRISVADQLNLSDELPPEKLTYFTKWGIFPSEKRKRIHSFNEYITRQTYQNDPDLVESIQAGNSKHFVDLLGLALMLEKGLN